MLSEKDFQKFLNERAKYVDDTLNIFDEQTQKAGRDLVNLIYEQYASKFVYVAGKLVMNSKNIALINQIDKVMNEFTVTMRKNALAELAQNMLKNTVIIKEWYGDMGIKQGALDKIIAKMGTIYESIGITETGAIIPGGYLDRLAINSALRDQLKNYVTSSITGKVELSKFQQGFKNLIVNRAGIDSSMTRYYKQYTHDAFMEQLQAQENYVSENFGVNEWFLYAGTEIKTTRPFCAERHGKVYSRKEAEKWNKLDWEGKKGDFFTYAGGYNCRHQIMWITEAAAKIIDPSKFE